MNFLFLLNGLLCLTIFIFFIVKFIQHFEKEGGKIARSFSFIGFIYFVISLVSFLWFFEVLKYAPNDFLFLYSVALIIQSLILFKVIYSLSKNKRLFYFLSFYLIGLFFLLFSINSFLKLSLIASSLFSLLLFIEFSFLGEHYRKTGYFGMFYSAISILSGILVYLKIGSVYSFNIVLSLAFLIFSFHFLKNLKKYSQDLKTQSPKEKSYFFHLLSHLIFIIAFTNFIFIGTVGVHEFGHFGTSKFFDCAYQKIVYDGEFFHTEILCSNTSSDFFVTLGGIALPFLVALFLFLVGGKFMKEVAILMACFNFIAISNDLSFLGISDNLIIVSIVLGVGLIIYGLLLLAKSRSEENLYFQNYFPKKVEDSKFNFLEKLKM